MADKKISALTALTAANVAPATDVVPIVDTSATETKKITAKDLVDGALNGGTANGVLYLNGSKAATSGSALVFDGTNLGIGTSSPSYPLSVVSANNGVVNVKGGTGTNQGSMFRLEAAGSTSALAAFGDRARIFGGTPDALVSIFTSAAPLTFDVAGAERMRLDASGNLGIGTSSPGEKLEVNGGGKFGGGTGGVSLFTAAGLRHTGTGGLFFDANSGGAEGNITFRNGSGFTTRFQITAAGSVVTGTQSALATTATDGFLYVPTCAGTPTGTPTAITGMAPIVVDTTNNKMYFYSGGQWRDAGP